VEARVRRCQLLLLLLLLLFLLTRMWAQAEVGWALGKGAGVGEGVGAHMGGLRFHLWEQQQRKGRLWRVQEEQYHTPPLCLRVQLQGRGPPLQASQPWVPCLPRRWWRTWAVPQQLLRQLGQPCWSPPIQHQGAAPVSWAAAALPPPP
jgi:hypothetical protein